jgi:hypothetical protein
MHIRINVYMYVLIYTYIYIYIHIYILIYTYIYIYTYINAPLEPSDAAERLYCGLSLYVLPHS